MYRTPTGYTFILTYNHFSEFNTNFISNKRCTQRIRIILTRLKL